MFSWLCRILVSEYGLSEEEGDPMAVSKYSRLPFILFIISLASSIPSPDYHSSSIPSLWHHLYHLHTTIHPLYHLSGTIFIISRLPYILYIISLYSRLSYILYIISGIFYITSRPPHTLYITSLASSISPSDHHTPSISSLAAWHSSGLAQSVTQTPRSGPRGSSWSYCSIGDKLYCQTN